MPKKIKKSPAKKVSKTPVKKVVSRSAPQTMDALLKKTGYALRGLKRGQKVQGIVTDINPRMVMIDIGSKTEGIVTDKELELSREMMSGLKVGDKIEA